MRTLVLALACCAAILAGANPARAQTCYGSVRLAVSGSGLPRAAPRAPPGFGVEVIAIARSEREMDSSGPPPPPLPFDQLLAEARRGDGRFVVREFSEFVRSGLEAGARLPPEREVLLRWGCGMHAARLVLTRGRQTMTLDLVKGPPHAWLHLEAPIPFRPGHWKLTLIGNQSSTGRDTHEIPLSGLERVEP
jgi:hypothetical protein